MHQRTPRSGGRAPVARWQYTRVPHSAEFETRPEDEGAIASRPASAWCTWVGVSGGCGPIRGAVMYGIAIEISAEIGRDQPEACWRSRLWSSLMMRSASSFSMLLIVLACDPDCMARRPRKWRRDTTLYAQCTVKSIARVGAPCCGGSRRKTGLPRE